MSHSNFQLKVASQLKPMRLAILGGSRGLGRAMVESTARPEVPVFVASRKLKKAFTLPESHLLWQSFDFTEPTDQIQLIESLKYWQPTHLIYVAGGGPYGHYAQKKWAAHNWAFELNLLFPARILHFYLSQSWAQQICLIGSSIAENQIDHGAASYVAAKSGLYWLVKNLKAESQLDIRWVSPGYLMTDLLPVSKQEEFKDKGITVHDPTAVAQKIWTWLLAAPASQQLGELLV